MTLPSMINKLQESPFRHWVLWLIILTCGLFPVVLAAVNESPDTSQGIYVITDFGARGDGKTLNTDIINSLIETCARTAQYFSQAISISKSRPVPL